MPAKQAAKKTDRPERVFLIDSMSHIFRAFYAPMQNRAAPLATSQGLVTQAVYIFTNMLLKLLREEKPDYIAAIFESREKTFRHETFADYKANRVAMPDDLAKQMPYIFRLCEVLNIPVINFPGYEADDVIGTLAQQVAELKMQAVIVSNDKDMCQLVHDPYIICMRQNSQVAKRKVPVPPIEWCDEAWVENKFGVPADKLVDLLGLMGDSIDNIPGAPGIGSKGAVSIIQQFGSIEAALAGWESVKHKTYRESLRNNADLIRQSRELARIRCDLEMISDGIDGAIDTLRDVLSNGLIEKSVHDMKRAVGLLDRFNITLEGVKDDTYLAAYLLDPNRSKYELNDLAREALNSDNSNAPAANWPD